MLLRVSLKRDKWHSSGRTASLSSALSHCDTQVDTMRSLYRYEFLDVSESLVTKFAPERSIAILNHLYCMCGCVEYKSLFSAFCHRINLLFPSKSIQTFALCDVRKVAALHSLLLDGELAATIQQR